MLSDGNLFRNLRSNLTDQTTGQILNVEGVNKVVLLQLDDTAYEYDDTLPLTFPKFKQEGSIDVINNVVLTKSDTKMIVEMNLFYKYASDYAPRYELNIIKNDELIHTRYCGVSDTTDTINNVYLVIVIDVVNGETLRIEMSKDTAENSTSSILILKNSYIQYKTF